MTKFTIPIEPKPQSRPRFSKWGTYENPKTKAWRNQCTGWIEKNYDGPFYDDSVKLEVTFFMKAPKGMEEPPRPRSREKKIIEYVNFVAEKIPYNKKIDLDNLEKSLYDSISKAGIVWNDDCLVVEHTTRKIYSPNPRIEVNIEYYEEN